MPSAPPIQAASELATPLPAATRRQALSPFPLWHLLSLDAPTVTLLWTLFTARIAQVPLPTPVAIAIFLAVWILYAADRLLDAAHLDPAHSDVPSTTLEPRHSFHHRHRKAFMAAIGAASPTLAWLIPRLPSSDQRLFLAEAIPLAAYFLLIHAPSTARNQRPLPKELLVGPFFAAATFIPTIAILPTLRIALVPHALLFTALCILNCLFIYSWENAHPKPDRAHWTTSRAIPHLPLLTLVFLAAAFVLILADHKTSPALARYPIACALSALGLLLLDRYRNRFSRLTLRAAADAALLTPLLLFPLAKHMLP